MPIKHAALKDYRKNIKHAKHNVRIKTHVKSLGHQFLALIKEGKKSEALVLVKKLQQAAAKAAKTRVYHKNKAARIISKAQAKINALK